MRDATGKHYFYTKDSGDFNPRIPCGMRQNINALSMGYLQYFNPRIPCGMRRFIKFTPIRAFGYFNPRIPCGMRLIRIGKFCK